MNLDSQPTAPRPTVAILVSRDLFFTSKVTGTADALGFRVEVVADAAIAVGRALAGDLRCIFIDLADPQLNVEELLSQLPAKNRPPIVAFGSHVATARLQAASDAGCDDVMPRSRFSAMLPELLRQYIE